MKNFNHITDVLAHTSTEHLVEELKKRGIFVNNNADVGRDWYYEENVDDCVEPYTDRNGNLVHYRTFYIIHKKFWHLNHCLMDWHIASQVVLPPDFNECCEAEFEYSGKGDPISLLEAFGYTKCPDVYYFSQLIGINENQYGRIELECDTKNIHDYVIREFSEKRDDLRFNNITSYVNWIEEFLESVGCMAIWDKQSNDRLYGTILNTHVYINLPVSDYL